MMMRLRPLKVVLAASCLALGAPAFAAKDGDISYIIKPTDTLYELAADYLVNKQAAREVQKLNGISNPRRMQIGTKLSIPRRLLKHRPVRLVLVNFSGKVDLKKNGKLIEKTPNLVVGEGTEISTGRNSFATINGEGNSRIAIPSNSRALIVDARRYLISDDIDVELRVLKGRGEVVAPKVTGDGRYQVGTPAAVTAVRGTEFRVAFEEGEDRSLTEVLEGNVNVAIGDSEVDTSAGFGLAAAGGALGEQEALLPAPGLIEPDALQIDKQLRFKIAPVEGAAAYRTQIARDQSFIDIVSEQIGETTEPVFETLPNARYSVRTRAISPSGLEGYASAADSSFRRKLVSVDAAVETSELADAFKFAWVPGEDSNTTYAFQIWPTKRPGDLVVNEVALKDTVFLVSDLPPGSYKWRVASLVIDEEDIIKVWGPAQEFVVSE